jgi:hypothetical protein
MACFRGAEVDFVVKHQPYEPEQLLIVNRETYPDVSLGETRVRFLTLDQLAGAARGVSGRLVGTPPRRSSTSSPTAVSPPWIEAVERELAIYEISRMYDQPPLRRSRSKTLSVGDTFGKSSKPQRIAMGAGTMGKTSMAAALG